MTKFLYNKEIYTSFNLKKALKKLGITKEDITILPEEKEEDCIDSSIKKHHFKLPNGYTITSIYNNLNHLNISEYEQID